MHSPAERGACLAVAAAVLLVLGGCGGSASQSAVTVPPAETPAIPRPPKGAVVFARAAGSNVLALGVVPRRGGLLLQASVLDGDGHGVPGLRVVFATGGVHRVGTACGAGCYRATVSPAGRPNAVSLAVTGRRATPTTWRVALPAAWPPPPAAAILARAGRAWRSLRSLAYVEHLASDPSHRETSTWRVAAPDRVAYNSIGSGGGIVIGARRWDRATPRGRWIESPQTAVLTQPVPFWAGVSDAHVLGTVTASGRPAWLVSFFDPVTPAWFEATVEKRTGHTLELRMFAAAHFMHDVYGSFNRAPAIVPPN